MTQNAKMDGYYQAQNLFTDPEDWTLLWETMRRELPVTFRVGASRVYVLLATFQKTSCLISHRKV